MLVYLDAQRILIYRYNFLVFEDCFVVWLDSPQVHGHQQRSGEYCPHRHLSFALLVGQTKVADDQLEYCLHQPTEICLI